ncbi:MAG TPA: hypothetical protein DEF47_17920 [Herpetosiphon sp.]|uniref:histidine kinase n=1 Tax=Herpetosiphon aurantiacus (strain ATCC 23779 / DSM 785 / 114-95) TaxID=316274 RepID=A9AYB8_HERA2|nr:GAF domain-containing protein [Herpetosiphon sp.]ABX03500.1 GAF sensor hybrid histidine kinase [Herpetosiphon aurantiacus DSM 785]HBW51774.1 hypothetical protein [Herpetosiphon sp.]
MYDGDRAVSTIWHEQLELLTKTAQEHFCLHNAELLIQRICALISHYLQTPRVTIALIQHDSFVAVASALGPLEDPSYQQAPRLVYSAGAAWSAVWQQQRSIITPAPTPDGMCQLSVPILRNAQLLGLIDIQSPQPEHKLSLLQPIIEMIAQQLALALGTLPSHRQHYREDQCTQIIEKINLHILKHLDVLAEPQQIIELIWRFLPLQGAALYLYDEQGLGLLTHINAAHVPTQRGIQPLSPSYYEQIGQQSSHNSAKMLLAGQHGIDIHVPGNQANLGLLHLIPATPFEANDLLALQEFGARLGYILEHNRLFRSMYVANERNVLFARIVSHIRQTMNLREVWQDVLATLGLGLRADFCTVALYEQEQRLRFHGTYTTLLLPDHLTAAEALLHSEMLQAFQQKRSLTIDEYHDSNDPELRERLLALNIHALAWVPLVANGQWLGFVCVYKVQRPFLWTLDDLRLINDVADQLALALRQMQLYEAERQRRRELEALQEIIRAISGELNLHALCGNVVEKVIDVFKVAAAAVLMWHNDGSAMQVVAHAGFSERYLDSLEMNTDTVNYWISRFKPPTPLYISDIRRVSLIGGDPASAEGLSSLFAQPLMVDGRFSGWLQMYSRGNVRVWNPEESHLAASIAQQISQAIHTARRYEQEHLLRTDAEQSYYQLRSVLDELENTRETLINSEKLRALGQLASGVAHDFNNLLASILGNAQFLLIHEDDADRRDALQVIERAAKDGAVTVRRIQEFARASETIYDDIVDLRDVVNIALEFTRPSWRDKTQQRGIKLDISTHLAAAHVQGSAAELREVCVNLVVNAIDVLPQGGTITISTGTTGEWSYFTIADNGPGIAPEDRTRIFEPFFSTKPIGEGTGMGLAVALSIVQRHRGKLLTEDVYPHGARFVVLLPIHHAPQPKPRPVAIVPKTAAQRILVVDDEPAVRNIVAKVLRHDQHEVTLAGSGEEALRWIDEQAFDLIISDLGMPGMNGWDVLEQARQRRPNIIAILITGWGYQHDADYAAARGVDSVLGKPFEMQTLRSTVADLIQARNTQGPNRVS